MSGRTRTVLNARLAKRIALGVGAAAVLALLLLPRVRRVQVHGEVKTATVGFTLHRPGQLLERNDLEWLSAEGVARMHGPRTTVESPDGRVSVLDTLQGKGALRLSSLRLPPRARVALRSDLAPRFVELVFACEGGCDEFQLDMDGGHFLRVNDAAGPVHGRRHYRLAGGGGATTLLFRSAESQPLDVGRNLGVVRLSFTRHAEATVNGVDRETETLSGVWGGTLRFPDIADRSHELTPGSQLRLELESAEIDAISVYADTIAVSFSGVARGITVGSGATARELLPRRIEWLNAQRTLMLLVTCVTALITLALTLRGSLQERT
jgi:hypothetical protein